MRFPWHSIAVAIIATSSLMMGHKPASACNTELVGLAIDDARKGLEGAARARSLPSAQDHAKDAFDGLRDTEVTLSPCGCRSATQEFGQASREAKSAWMAFKADGFADDLKDAIRHFNKAIDELNVCRPRRRQ